MPYQEVTLRLGVTVMCRPFVPWAQGNECTAISALCHLCNWPFQGMPAARASMCLSYLSAWYAGRPVLIMRMVMLVTVLR